MSAWARVSKQMVQMFGPQWSEKFGATNDAWDEALAKLSYAQVSAGLNAVRQGKLRFYELDLPNFLGLCRAETVAFVPQQRYRPDWQRGLSADEIDLRRRSILKLIAFVQRHPKFGLRGEERLPEAAERALWTSTHRLAHDYYEMKLELGEEHVPDDDLFQSLERQWRRDLEVSA